jgi:hypothetical protein
MAPLGRLTKSALAGIAGLGLVAVAYFLWYLPAFTSAFPAVGWGGYWEFTLDKWRTGGTCFVVFATAFLWQYRRSR